MRRLGRRGRVLAGVTVALAAVLVAASTVLLLAPAGGDGDGAVSPLVAPDTGGGADRTGHGPFPAAAAPEPAPSDLAAGAPAQPLPAVPVGRSVVRTAHVTVEVADPAAAVREIRTTATAAGGLVAEEQADDTGARLVLRVPAADLDRLVEEVTANRTVPARSGRVEDVTEQVVDLDARVASQQASVNRVRALLAEAESIGDVVAVESELARREAELQSLRSRLEMLRDQVALATLVVELRGPDTPGADDPTPLGFLAGLGAGWDGLRALGAAAAAVIGFALPFLPLLALLAGVARAVRRARRGRRPAATPSPSG